MVFIKFTRTGKAGLSAQFFQYQILLLLDLTNLGYYYKIKL